LSEGDKARIDSLFPKAFSEDFVTRLLALMSAGEKKLFLHVSNESHCLHPQLPKQRNNEVLNSQFTAATTTYSHKLSQLCLRIVSLVSVSFLIFSVLCVFVACVVLVVLFYYFYFIRVPSVRDIL